MHAVVVGNLTRIKNAIADLEKLAYPTPTRIAQDKNMPVEAKLFNHGGRRK